MQVTITGIATGYTTTTRNTTGKTLATFAFEMVRNLWDTDDAQIDLTLVSGTECFVTVNLLGPNFARTLVAEYKITGTCN